MQHPLGVQFGQKLKESWSFTLSCCGRLQTTCPHADAGYSVCGCFEAQTCVHLAVGFAGCLKTASNLRTNSQTIYSQVCVSAMADRVLCRALRAQKLGKIDLSECTENRVQPAVCMPCLCAQRCALHAAVACHAECLVHA